MALGKTARELTAALTAGELAEWEAYYGLEPWGEQRADLRAGIIAATAAAPWRKAGSPPPRPTDYMPRFEAGPGAPQSDEQMGQALRALAERAGRAAGRRGRKPKP